MVQNRHFHHTLFQVSGFIFNNLDSDNFFVDHILALDNLAKCSLPEHIQHQIPSLFFDPENIINKQNVVAIFIIKAIVKLALTWLGENALWIFGALIIECRIANVVGGRKMLGKSLEWTKRATLGERASVLWNWI